MRASIPPILFCAVLVLLSPAARAAASEASHYQSCLAASSAQPESALRDAESWVKQGGGVPAQHCAALSLVSLKRYAEAAGRLDKLAAEHGVPDAAFRSALSDQAGNAWLLAGDGAKAVQSFSAALTLSGDDPDLFADLARAQALRKNWHEVDLDLNAALHLTPRRPDLLVLRASARRALGRYNEARTDLEAALKLQPGDGEALVERGLLRRQVGDLGGARRDFEAAQGKGGAAAAQARENLGLLSGR